FFCTDLSYINIYLLSLHDALPISAFSMLSSFADQVAQALVIQYLTGSKQANGRCSATTLSRASAVRHWRVPSHSEQRLRAKVSRSEEHTSELQSQSNLVCRLLLEK